MAVDVQELRAFEQWLRERLTRLDAHIVKLRRADYTGLPGTGSVSQDAQDRLRTERAEARAILEEFASRFSSELE